MNHHLSAFLLSNSIQIIHRQRQLFHNALWFLQTQLYFARQALFYISFSVRYLYMINKNQFFFGFHKTTHFFIKILNKWIDKRNCSNKVCFFIILTNMFSYNFRYLKKCLQIGKINYFLILLFLSQNLIYCIWFCPEFMAFV